MFRRLLTYLTFSGSLFLWLPLATASAQDAADQREIDKAVIDHWLDISKKYATEYEIAPADDPEAPFQLVPEPVFRHTQSVRGDDIGAVHLWVNEEGRPAVVGVMFAFSRGNNFRQSSVEFHSLYPAPIAANFRSQPLWESRTPGLKWHEFPDGTTRPADTATRRLLQMRQLARRFEAHTVDFQQKRWELRQVPTPIFDYKVDAEGTLGGALFAFCQGTDTEVVLAIEAREADGRPAYHYAYAPFTDYDVFLKLDDQTVEQAPKGRYGENGNPHFWNPIEAVPKPEFERNR